MTNAQQIRHGSAVGSEGIGRRKLLAGGLSMVALATLTTFAPVGLASAQASNAPQQIADHFSSVRTMMGEFIQFSPRGEQTEGKFFIERPGKLRFNYEPPAAFRVTSDGQTVVLENTRMRTADVYPLARTPLKLLLDDRIDLSEDKVRRVSEDEDLTTIELADTSMFGDSTITMMFDPQTYELRQWTVTDARGQDTTVMIYNVQQGVDFDPSVFAIDTQRINQMNQREFDR